MITRHLTYAVIAVILVTGLVVPGVSSAQAESLQKSREYFIRQSADEDLFIRINGFEAALDAAISVQDGRDLVRSGLPGTRLIPVFQYVNAPDSNRQLNIRVSSARYTNRSEFGLELTRLKIWDERSSAVSRAYNLLANGMFESQSNSAADWTVRIDGLINAGRLFQQFGMQEMRLWSNYLAAHQILFHLNDFSIVYSMTRDILSELPTARFQTIELATLQLQSAALMGLKRSGTLPASSSDPDPLQSVLARSADLATAMDYSYELAIALEASGNAYVADAFYPEALEQFRKAVEIADHIGDGELATQIRESIVRIHALQGDTGASTEVLQKIEKQLQEKGSADELALNLLEQGRLHIRHYRYDQAVDSLYESMGYQNNSAIRQRINFELAQAFYHTGRLDDAISYLGLAGLDLKRPQQLNFHNIDAATAWWMMANIYRSKGQFEQMRIARKAQARHQTDRGSQLYDEGMDEMAVGGTRLRSAESLFKQAYTHSAGSGITGLQDLSLLSLCVLAPSTDPLCARAGLSKAHESLANDGIPINSIQGMFLWSQILVSDGRFTGAVKVLNKLISEIHLYRYAFPGVLGGWYHEKHEQIFEYYLQLLSRESNRQSRVQDLASLLVLSRIRLIEKHASLTHKRFDSAKIERLRLQIAELKRFQPGLARHELKGQVNEGVNALRKPFNEIFGFLSKPGLQTYMRGLAVDEAVITYHINPNTAQVWVMRKDGVYRQNIENPAYIYSALQEAREGLPSLSLASFDHRMEELGRRLAKPVKELLPETVYWIPAGPLLGFPLDALRLDGRYLLEDHKLVNLVSFPEDPGPSKSTGPVDQQSMFVAGFPQDYAGEYATSLRTSTEIRTVADIFVGPGLTIVQGAALLPDEFQSEQFQQAGLIHLSMPGVLDLSDPAKSSFELSGYEGGMGRALLKPFDIQSLSLQADLVFLSASRTNGKAATAFISQTGFISQLIDAGSRAVIGRIWMSSGGVSDAFVRHFYGKLGATGNVADALTESKRHFMTEGKADDNYDWAGYQLFIR